jgi:hypothetical protein
MVTLLKPPDPLCRSAHPDAYALCRACSQTHLVRSAIARAIHEDFAERLIDDDGREFIAVSDAANIARGLLPGTTPTPRCEVCGRRPQDPWPHNGFLCGHCDDYSSMQAAAHLIDGLGVILGPIPVELRDLLRDLLATDALPVILSRLLEWEGAANGDA